MRELNNNNYVFFNDKILPIKIDFLRISTFFDQSKMKAMLHDLKVI